MYEIEFLNYIIVLSNVITCRKNFMAFLLYCINLYFILKWDKIATYHSKASKFVAIGKIITTRDGLF